MRKRVVFLIVFVLLMIALVSSLVAQSTAFSYQGNLKDGANAANGTYDFEFLLFDALSSGNQLGSTATRSSVSVSNGSFTVSLDFGNQFPGANRYLEIHVRSAGSGNFTALAPRQQISNSPYSVRSLNATSADNATTAANATNAQQLGGVSANQYVVTGDARMSDARIPSPGSGNYIQNGTASQTATFNVNGKGSADTFDAATQFNIAGNRVLSNAGTNNLFAGQGSGNINSGGNNAFFGWNAGVFNTLGSSNSFFGAGAGANTDAGGNNAFFGASAGFNSNGQLTNGNTFIGAIAGSGNTTGRGNTLIGFSANVSFPSTLNNVTAIGSNALVTRANSLVLGSINGVNNASADTNVGIGVTAPLFKLHVIDPSNTGLRIQTNTTGGTVASFGGTGAFQVDAPGVIGGRFNIAENGNIGIGQPSPAFPLNFANSLGDKISLWGNSGAMYGFGIQSSLLQIHTDQSASDIAFGFGSSGSFTERMRFRGSGAIAIGGNDGSVGQVITSSGSGAAPQWKSPTNTLYQSTNMNSTAAAIAPPTGTLTLVPGLSQTVSVSGDAKLLVQYAVQASSGVCLGCSNSVAEIDLTLNGGLANRMEYELINSSHTTMTGSWLMSVGPGSYTIEVKAELLSGPSVTFGCGTGCGGYNSYLIVQVIPQ